MRTTKRVSLSISMLLFAGRVWAAGLAGSGSATIDGILSPGEWDEAAFIAFQANIPKGGTTPAGLWVMNDSQDLYLAVQFARDFVDPLGNSLSFEFDSNNNGVLDDGDDGLVVNAAVGFFDYYRTTAPPCPPFTICGPEDTDPLFGPPGTADGEGVFAHEGALSVYEVSHPLDSGDAGHDFSLHAGESIGFSLSLRMIGPGGQYPDDFGDTDFPGFPFGGTISITSVQDTGPTCMFLGVAVAGILGLRRKFAA